MRKRRVAVLALVWVVALIGGVVAIAGAGGNSTDLKARLNGFNEIGPTGERGAGDLNGRGNAKVEITLNRRAMDEPGEVCFDLNWRNIGAPDRAHIHAGARDVNGPIVVSFFDQPGNPLPATISAVSGCVEGVDGDLAKDIARHPRQYYVNIHNADFPAGAIRGQLRKD